MMHFNNKALLVAFLVLGIPNFLWAEDQAAEKQSGATSIDPWIEQLNDDSLTKRQQARRELITSGKAAIPKLAKAALSDKRDVIDHSIDILAEIANTSEDEEARKAARTTLELLSESDQPSTAQRAKLALNAKKGDGIQPFPGWDQPGDEFAGNQAVANHSVSVSNINGIKTITVTEAGKITTLRDEPSGAIRVRIEQGDAVQEFAVKNLDELERKNSAAFALYKQHSGGARGFANSGFFRRFGNFGNDAKTVINQDANIHVNGTGDGANTANQMMLRQLTELKRRMVHSPEMQRMIDEQIKNLKRH